jgi:hypothetical protein
MCKGRDRFGALPEAVENCQFQFISEERGFTVSLQLGLIYIPMAHLPMATNY